MDQQLGRKLGRVVLALAAAGALYLVIAWVVTMNSDACWYPWHDVLPNEEHLCGLGM